MPSRLRNDSARQFQSAQFLNLLLPHDSCPRLPGIDVLQASSFKSTSPPKRTARCYLHTVGLSHSARFVSLLLSHSSCLRLPAADVTCRCLQTAGLSHPARRGRRFSSQRASCSWLRGLTADLMSWIPLDMITDLPTPLSMDEDSTTSYCLRAQKKTIHPVSLSEFLFRVLLNVLRCHR
ncbi:hypothetical protein K1T71_010822 [Dendrolimus kikuchii]|uniref:Uncharacterized protein n=1 Tax=Dendrolimus kikuchii TaxID=765133 RepID=A0ACC1CPY3_9NEOP|nr:hypothetical protein K1T71_010822 [Dendrolimus kikuchii]